MTSLLTQLNNSTIQSDSQQQTVEENFIHIPKLHSTTAMDFIFSNQAKPSSLLAKRLDTSELGDLLTKRIKTQSTNVSENGSLQQSPTSKKSLNISNSAMEQEKGDISPGTTITRCSSSESSVSCSNQDSSFSAAVVIEIDSQSMMPAEDNTHQLQQALDILREKMVEQEAQFILEMFIKAQLSQEPLYIPPLLEPSSDLSETSNNKAKKQKKNQEDRNGPRMYLWFRRIPLPFHVYSFP
jgi:hypothetical protein